MKPSKNPSQTVADELGCCLHLVTPHSAGRPLCGTSSVDAAIGAYCEHLDDQGEWCRQVFGRSGKTGTACEACLALYPSLLWGRPSHPNDGIELQAVIKISPYPQSIREEFSIKGFCVSDDFIVESNPYITGQRVIDGKMALTIVTRIIPKQLGKR